MMSKIQNYDTNKTQNDVKKFKMTSKIQNYDKRKLKIMIKNSKR